MRLLWVTSRPICFQIGNPSRSSPQGKAGMVSRESGSRRGQGWRSVPSARRSPAEALENQERLPQSRGDCGAPRAAGESGD